METEFEATLGYEKNQKADFLTDKKMAIHPRYSKATTGNPNWCSMGLEWGIES